MAGQSGEQLVVAARASGNRPPLWAIHPIGGSALWVRHLLSRLPEGQPLYGIQARGLEGRDAPHETVPAMATDYIEVIRGVQPRGPYYLCGASFGGTVAFEMAQQLRGTGEEVGLLALLDSYGPDYPARPSVWQRVRRFRDKSWSERFDAVSGRVLSPLTVDLEDIAGATLVESVRRVTEANQRAMESYRPSPYPGTLVLVRASVHPEEMRTSFDDPSNGWTRVAPGRVEVVPIATNHARLLDPPAIHEVGAALAKAMDAALG